MKGYPIMRKLIPCRHNRERQGMARQNIERTICLKVLLSEAEYNWKKKILLLKLYLTRR